MKKCKLFILIILTVPSMSFTPEKNEGFIHKGYYGWLIDLSRTAHIGIPWPSVLLDQPLIDDFKETTGFLQRSGMNEITIWGLFTNSNWEPKIENTIDAEREKKVKEVIEDAHRKGLKMLCGLGIYSWGFDKIMNENPGLRCPCNKDAMDMSNPQAWEWQKKVIDYLMDNFEFDGMSMQSADRGGCKCGKYLDMPELEYHALLNQKVVDYIRSKRKDYIIGITGWNMNFRNPTDFNSIVKMCRNVDFLIDVEETALRAGRDYRKKLIKAIAPCTYGSSGTPNIEPIQALPRDLYFVPTVVRTCQKLKELYNDGGKACETYSRTRGNVGDEVTIEVIAIILSEPQKSTESALKDVLKMIFHPSDERSLEELAAIFIEAENAYFTYATGNKDVIMLLERQITAPKSQYLTEMSPSSRIAYEKIMKDLNDRVIRLRGKVENGEKYQALVKCLHNVLEELKKIEL